MSDLGSLRKKIAGEETRLARVEKELDEALAKLQERPAGWFEFIEMARPEGFEPPAA